jgi:hypothetical protein
MDVVGTATVVNNRPWQNLPYGPMGGGTYYTSCVAGDTTSNVGSHPAFVVITVIAGTRNIFIDTAGPGSLTLPSDFVSLVSVEVLGAGGAGASSTSSTSRYAGGGGGGWAKTYGSSIASGLVAGSTVYYNVGTSAGIGQSWINMFSDAIPGTTAYGVGVQGGAAGSGSVGGSGGSAYTSDTWYSGGNGGTGSPLSRNNAGGGGGAGSPFGGGGAGGNAYTGSTSRGQGGGGYTGAGTISASAGALSNGGAGGSVTSGAGGSGGNSGYPPGYPGQPYLTAYGFNFITGPFTSGAGGGGGGFTTTYLSSTSNTPGLYDNGIIRIAAGAGGGYGGSLSGFSFGGILTSYYGAGGGGNSVGSAGGPGWVLITYTAAYIAPTNKSNLLAFF